MNREYPEIDSSETNLGQVSKKIIIYGSICLALATLATCGYRNMERSGKAYEERMSSLRSIQEQALAASPQELSALGGEWITVIKEGRKDYTPGSRRRRSFEVSVAAAGIALSTAIAETLGRPAETDVLEAIELASELKTVASDDAVRAISKVSLSQANAILAGAAKRGVAAMGQLSQSNQDVDLQKAAVIAQQLAGIVAETEQPYFLNMADSLQGVLARRSQMSQSQESQVDPATRRDMAINIREYLVRQGVSVTGVNVGGENNTILVIKGLGESEKLGGLILNSPAAQARLKEAGFKQLQVEGTSGAKMWNLQEIGNR